ncbi:MAG: protein O-mannosyl-transferase family, partial [Ardenticatenaceae bacterium]
MKVVFGLFLFFLALYASMAAPGLDWGDAGEAQLAAWTGGLSHPTGYPLFLMLGWLWTHALAPLGVPPTRAMTLLSSLAGAAAVAFTFPAMRALLRRTGIEWGEGWLLIVAVLTAITFGLSQTMWSQALQAEVYTLNALFLVLLLWGLWRPGLSLRRLPWLALLYGLAIGHHRLMLLWLPGLVGFWILDSDVDEKPKIENRVPARAGESKINVVLLSLLLLVLP